MYMVLFIFRIKGRGIYLNIVLLDCIKYIIRIGISYFLILCMYFRNMLNNRES